MAFWLYFYCNERVGVTMPSFENINRQCSCGFWWFPVVKGG